MIDLHAEEYNDLLYSGQDLLLFFCRPGEAQSELQESILKDVDRLIPKRFEICRIQCPEENLLMELFNVKETPQMILLRDKRIYKRQEGYTPYQIVIRMMQ